MSVLVIFGSRTALEVAEAASLGHPNRFADILVRYFEEPEFSDSIAPALESKYKRVFYHAGVADIATKHKIVTACKTRDWIPFSVIHPTAVVAASASIGSGCFVGPLAVVSSHAKLGDHVIVHIHASIGHDSILGEYSSVLPGARVSGNVKVGCRVLVGSNAFLNAGIAIGDDSQIDALTYVARDLPSAMIQSVRTPQPIPRLKKDNR
jgi:UDP-3-O-[3-hydroxymyristoyl] glucosamine N-acyltransferase